MQQTMQPRHGWCPELQGGQRGAGRKLWRIPFIAAVYKLEPQCKSDACSQESLFKKQMRNTSRASDCRVRFER